MFMMMMMIRSPAAVRTYAASRWRVRSSATDSPDTVLVKSEADSRTVLPNLFWPVTKNRTPTLGRYPPDPPIKHEQQYFSQNCPFISVARPIKK